MLYLTCGDWPRSLDAGRDVRVLGEREKEQEEWLSDPEYARAIKKRKFVSKNFVSNDSRRRKDSKSPN